MDSIGDLKSDPHNCRRHNPRNIGAIVKSLNAVGAARSIVIDEDNTILAGNGLVEAAAEAGIEKLRVVEADGNTVVAVRRTGLSAKQKAQLAILDNRTSELAEWDAQELNATIEQCGIDLGEVEFTEAELFAASQTAQSAPGETSGRTLDMAKKRPMVKVVIAAKEVSEIEAAIAATGEMNRGDAVLEICWFYVSQKGQQHIPLEARPSH